MVERQSEGLHEADYHQKEDKEGHNQGTRPEDLFDTPSDDPSDDEELEFDEQS